MDTKGRIGLAIAVIATVLSLVSVMADITVTPASINAASFLTGCKVKVASGLTTLKDASFTSPSTCAGHGNLDTNANMNALCANALSLWSSKANAKCAAIVLQSPFIGDSTPFSPCRITGASWNIALANAKRTCEEDPGHFSKLICTVTADVNCADPADCLVNCETITNANTKKACVEDCTGR